MFVPCLLLLCITLVNGRMTFQAEIPNGDSVPHPCGGTWGPVGHRTTLHPNKNTVGYFGADFRLEGFTWTKNLCNMDSDLDGKSNGVELGDPTCIWTKLSGLPPFEAASGHPGINEDNYFC